MKYYRVFYIGENKEGKKVYRVRIVYALNEEVARKNADNNEHIEEQESDNIDFDEDIAWEYDHVTDAPCMD